MNKFRANLHPAFFYGEKSGTLYNNDNYDPKTNSYDLGNALGPDREVVVTGHKKEIGEERKKILEENQKKALESLKNIKVEAITKVVEENKGEEAKLKKDISGNNEHLTSSTTSVETNAKKEQVDEKLKTLRDGETILETDIRRNNESEASSIEKKEITTDKELEKVLKQLAKNKKIDFPWTDNAWKCSRTEKKLATSSAKVFQQLLDAQTLTQMIGKCKSKSGELNVEEAEAWKSELKINSKSKDIQNFYKSFKEYQNPQSEYQHLKNLMGFFCENDFSNIEGVRQALEIRSEKITKEEINKTGKLLYQEGEENGEYVIIDNKTGEKIDKKPKDWKKRASFEVIKNRLKEGGMSKTDKMLTLLGDLNLDGEVNSGDVGYKAGSQFVDVFRRTVATKQLENPKFDDDIAAKNLIDYANKFGLDIKNEITTGQPGDIIQNLYNWMTDDKKGYENTVNLQNFLKNLSIELSDVLTNGANAGKQSLDRMVSAIGLEKKEEEAAKKAAEEKAKEIVSAGEKKLKEKIKDDRERADITQQLLTQLPGLLLDKAMGEKGGLGVGYGVPLDQIIKGMSAGFNVGIGTDGKPKFGLFVGRDRKFDLSKTTDLRTAASAGTRLLFVPCVAASMELGQEVNKGSREASLDAKGEHRITLGGNVTAVPGIFSIGALAGYENKKKEGIEKQAQNINSVLREQSKAWIEGLKTLKPKEGAKEVTFEQKKEALKAILEKEFKNSSPKTLETAANNLLSIIQQFKIDEKTTSQDFDTYAQIVGDVYSKQWEGAALAGIADNKRKISGGKVGIQFIEGCVPIATLVAKFTKYRNARTNETEHSRVARIDAQVNGVGNGKNILEKLKVKELGEEQVNQINEILKRYGAKSEVKYIAGKGGKPGRIQIPASITDGIGINVRVSESMKGYVLQWMEKRIGGETFYQFPANATYRLLQETGGNQRSLTLNIGSDKSSTSDVIISDAEGMKNLLGNNELMGGKKWQDKEAVRSGFDEVADKLSLLSGLEDALRDMDTDNRKTFSEFTRNKTQARENFNDVVKAFTEALDKSPKIDAATKKDFIEKFNALGNEDKQLIIDRVISIAAYYEDVHNEAGLQKRIDARVKRGDKYRTLTGPNGKEIFSKFGKDYRSEVVKDLKSSSYASESMPNILGATAFYNKRLDNDARGLGITGLGVTTVLGGKTVPLDSEDAEKAKNRFLGEKAGKSEVKGVIDKEKSPMEWNNLKNMVKEKLPDWAKNKFGDDNLKEMLSGKTVEIRLDNLEKKVKVNMNVDYVFYLMGECANESVGMQLGDLTIVENGLEEDYRQGALYLNNGDGSNEVEVDEKNAAIGRSFGGQRKKEEENKEEKKEEKPDYTDGSDPSDGKEPDDNTIPEVDGGPIDQDIDDSSNPSDGAGGTDNLWTEGGKNGGDSPDVDASDQGDL